MRSGTMAGALGAAHDVLSRWRVDRPIAVPHHRQPAALDARVVFA